MKMVHGIDVEVDCWFKKFHAEKVTRSFMAWWKNAYGIPSNYSSEETEQHEYWVRCAFALAGWRAAQQHKNIFKGE